MTGVAEPFGGGVAEHLITLAVDDHDALGGHRERAGQAVSFGGERFDREQ
jgi:hypothetical protein